MTAHNHRTIVDGCFRCELSMDELDPRFDIGRPRTSPGGCICDGGSFEVQRYPFIVHRDCAVHGSMGGA